jgi:hypothetical protein
MAIIGGEGRRRGKAIENADDGIVALCRRAPGVSGRVPRFTRRRSSPAGRHPLVGGVGGVLVAVVGGVFVAVVGGVVGGVVSVVDPAGREPRAPFTRRVTSVRSFSTRARLAGSLASSWALPTAWESTR